MDTESNKEQNRSHVSKQPPPARIGLGRMEIENLFFVKFKKGYDLF
jgi:hypothetical protein